MMSPSSVLLVSSIIRSRAPTYSPIKWLCSLWLMLQVFLMLWKGRKSSTLRIEHGTRRQEQGCWNCVGSSNRRLISGSKGGDACPDRLTSRSQNSISSLLICPDTAWCKLRTYLGAKVWNGRCSQ